MKSRVSVRDKAAAMSDEKRDPMPIPAFIRTMLDPFVNVMGHSGNHTKPKIELTLLDTMFRPTDLQAQAIGRACTAWSVLERVMGMAIARLALSPEDTTLALTRELSANNQLKVLRVLIPLHRERYGTQIVNDALIEKLLTFPSKITVLKDKRNEIAHTDWYRKNDEVVGAMRSRPTTYSKAAAEKEDSNTTNISEMTALAVEIQSTADELFVLIQLLPPVDEVQHAQFLAQEVENLHRQVLPERPPQPESPLPKE